MLIVPRWAGSPGSDFYPWLLDRLRSEHPGLFAEARALALPRPELPDVQAWPDAISQALGTDADLLARTYVIAHSVGCQALLRSLAELPEGRHVAGVLCVAGWWEIDRPWDSIRPWLTPIPHLERVRAAAGDLQDLGMLRVLLSDDDPFTADHAANQRAWQERLGARVELVRGGRHFNAAEEPAVLAALLALCGGRAG